MLLAQAQVLLCLTTAVVRVGIQPTCSAKNSTLHMCGMASTTPGVSSWGLTVRTSLYLYGLSAATLPEVSNGVKSSLHHKHAHVQLQKASTCRFNALTAKLSTPRSYTSREWTIAKLGCRKRWPLHRLDKRGNCMKDRQALNRTKRCR